MGLGEVLDSRQVKVLGGKLMWPCQVPHLMVVPCLVITMLAGPLGFLLYLSVRCGS